MADIINNPGDNRGSGSTAWILGLIVVVLLVLFLVFMLPGLSGNPAETTEETNPILPPPVETTIINSTSTINLNGTTTDEE